MGGTCPPPAPRSLLIVLSRQTLLVTPSFTSIFAPNFHLNYPRPAPIWPCTSVAQLVEQWRSIPEVVRGEGIFSFCPCGPISFLRLSLRRYYLGYWYSAFTYHIQTTLYAFYYFYLFHSPRHTMSEIPRNKNKNIKGKNRGVARGPQKPDGLYEEVPLLALSGQTLLVTPSPVYTTQHFYEQKGFFHRVQT